MQQDTSGWDLDAPVPELPPLHSFTGPKGRYATIQRLIAVHQPRCANCWGCWPPEADTPP
ncbi:hypothetical protein [Arthrobacter sp. JCM 19049]|uniref:hypothetical protein n=1 Tax=Arthrobacter sp. JCM 19049 TaxID=1460643 RepID=UPI000AEFC514|nr:hypothetical protein [Arthrobacter sp. JCM 19049]